MINRAFIEEFGRAVDSPEDNLAVLALMLGRLEQPRLDADRYLAELDAMGEAAQRRVAGAGGLHASGGVEALNEYLFDEQGFEGNRAHYDDPRNSFLNEVLDRRTGIPITLALVYMEVARRAGVQVHGINFPGHFLLRCGGGSTPLILDPFHGGAVLSEDDCRELLRRHAGDDVSFTSALLAPADKRQILTRMLVNLKRSYVRLRSFPQARAATELLLALDPSDLIELRDRALLSYQLNDLPAALRDLEAYLRLAPPAEDGDPRREELNQIWEHVKVLRRRVASFN